MKWFLRVIATLILLLLIFMAAVLVPAHLQVRSVSPELPSQNELLSLLGSKGPSRASYVLTSSQQLERGQISHISILLEWEIGQGFLIDTGMSRDQAGEFAELLKKMDSSAGEVTINGTVAELLGNNLDKVTGVGFTHLHIDHTQGVEDFCQAKGEGAVLWQTPSQRNLHNFNTSEGAELLASSCLKPLEFPNSANNGVENFYQSEQFPGLAAIELGGHTPGSTLWAVALGGKVLLFSGDITNDKLSLDHDKPKPALYSYMLVPEHTKRTAQLRQWLRGLDKLEAFSVIVSHDLANTQAHLTELKRF